MATIRSSRTNRYTGASWFKQRPLKAGRCEGSKPLATCSIRVRLPGLGLARLFAGRQSDFRHPPAVQGHPGILGDRVFVGIAQRLVRGDAVLIAAGNLVALLVSEELLD